MRALHAKSLTVDLLSATGVGKVVAQLRKHESTKASAMAAALVGGAVTAQGGGVVRGAYRTGRPSNDRIPRT